MAGRNGVRESLEETTMNLARATAAFLSANLFYPTVRPWNAFYRRYLYWRVG